jgi:hypothetical protein
MQNMWPNPRSTLSPNKCIADCGQAQSPVHAMKTSPEPSQTARASLPRSIQRPTRSAVNTGIKAKPVAMMPSQATGRPSSSARYDVVIRTRRISV